MNDPALIALLAWFILGVILGISLGVWLERMADAHFKNRKGQK